MKKVELLSPAGDMERLTMSLAYGADAVYLAGNAFGMRAFAGNFDRDEMTQAVQLAHDKGVRVHVTCNTLARNDEIARLPEYLEFLESIGVDAVISAGVDVLSLAHRYAPHVEVHMSTQTGITNYEMARVWHDLGAKRVILARELSLDEIREIRAKAPRELEMEVFAHGAMCVSYSGRCLLSNYMTGRDSNRGECAQPCRWSYSLMEEKRPGEYFPIVEDGGTYIMNSRDMRMIEHIPELLEAGIDSFKIEGRMKSAYYAAIITNAYRHGIDAALRGEPLEPVWLEETEKVSHRPYCTGFYYDYPGQHYAQASYSTRADVAAVVESCDGEGNAVLSQRNKFCAGDELELVCPRGKPELFRAEHIYDSEGTEIEDTRHPMMEIHMRLPRPAPRLSIIRKCR